MASSSFEDAAMSDTPQIPPSKPFQGDGEENLEHEIGDEGHEGRRPPIITMASLQQDLKALQSKMKRMERQNALEMDSDTEEDIPEFDKDNQEDANGFPDDATWSRVWNGWMARRKIARNIIRKSNRLQKLKSQGRLRQNHLTNSDSSDDDQVLYKTKPLSPMDGASNIVPSLKLYYWAEFKPSNASSRPCVPAIEILIGKPNVNWYLNRRSGVSGERTNNPPMEDPTVTDGRVSKLPDRIRVNSRLLLLMFARIHRTSLFNMFQNLHSVVFLRPFKMLVFFEKELRDHYENLSARQSKGTSVNNSEAETTNQGLEHQSAPTAGSGPQLKTSEVTGSPISATGSSDEQVTSDPKTDTTSAEVVENSLVDSEMMLEHMHPLIQFMDDFIAPRQTYLRGYDCQKVTFDDMWLLFKPGDEVIQSNGDQAYRVIEVETKLHRAIPPWEGLWKPTTLSSGPKITDPSNAFLPPPPPPDPDPWSREGDNKPFVLWCVHIDSDGVNIGPVTTEITIDSFEGERFIFDLDVYPLRLRAKDVLGSAVPSTPVPSIRDQLIERGKRFTKMSGIQHAYYSGTIHGTQDRLEGQVVVDNSLVFHSDSSKDRPEVKSWVQAMAPVQPFDGESAACSATCCIEDAVWSDRSFDLRRNSEYMEMAIPTDRTDSLSLAALECPIASVNKSEKEGKITDSEYLIMSDRVWGFILRDRRWVELNLRFISEVNYQREEPFSEPAPEDMNVTNTAFDDLVLPDGHKKVILSLVAQQLRKDEHREADIIRGKGKGLIILLHGAPGVGKTSTAEGIAEAFERPLLQITSGDLGLTADQVGESLQRNFDLASRWDGILLLDEADVFLASRSGAENSADLNRNALVAVFLRVLEYYTGILFLTTNRIGDFDEAFASRIHLSLEYPKLNKESTESILALNMELIKKRFRKTGKTIDIEETKICSKFTAFWEHNMDARLNGRQIRNACQTALALAEFEAQGNNYKAAATPDAIVRLRPSHFDTILGAYLDFAVYLNKTYGISPDERAKEQKLRARDRTRKARTSHGNGGSTGSQAEGFPGAHLYSQSVQQPAQGQNGFQVANPGAPVYVMSPQGQQFYQGQMSSQQGFQNPMQYPNQNVTLPVYPGPAGRNDQHQLPVPNVQQPFNETEDAQAGHSGHHRVQSASPGSVSQYAQSQQHGTRY